MHEFLASSAYFGLVLTLAAYQLPRLINRRLGRQVLNPLLFSILACSLVLLALDIRYETYYQGAGLIDALLTPARHESSTARIFRRSSSSCR